jgi:hypothetical protein
MLVVSIVAVIAWLVMGWIGAVIVMTEDGSIVLWELTLVFIGGIPGPIMLITALLSQGMIWNPVIFKSRKREP